MNKPIHASSHESGLAIWELVIILLILAFVAAVMFPVFNTSHRGCHISRCLTNVKRLGVAMTMYRQDHEGAFPNAGSWNGDLITYTEPPPAFFCPEAKDKTFPTYAMNRNLAGTNEKNVPDPFKVIAIFDSIPGKNLAGESELLPPFPRHNGGNFCAFVDGHAKWLKRGDARMVWILSK